MIAPRGVCASCNAEKPLAVYAPATRRGYCAECVGYLRVATANVSSSIDRAVLREVLGMRATRVPPRTSIEVPAKDEEFWRRTLGEDPEGDPLPPPSDRRLPGETLGQFRARLARARTKDNVRRRPPRVVR